MKKIFWILVLLALPIVAGANTVYDKHAYWDPDWDTIRVIYYVNGTTSTTDSITKKVTPSGGGIYYDSTGLQDSTCYRMVIFAYLGTEMSIGEIDNICPRSGASYNSIVMNGPWAATIASKKVKVQTADDTTRFGTDQARIANPTASVNLSGTTIKTATDVVAQFDNDTTLAAFFRAIQAQFDNDTTIAGFFHALGLDNDTNVIAYLRAILAAGGGSSVFSAADRDTIIAALQNNGIPIRVWSASVSGHAAGTMGSYLVIAGDTLGFVPLDSAGIYMKVDSLVWHYLGGRLLTGLGFLLDSASIDPNVGAFIADHIDTAKIFAYMDSLRNASATSHLRAKIFDAPATDGGPHDSSGSMGERIRVGGDPTQWADSNVIQRQVLRTPPTGFIDSSGYLAQLIDNRHMTEGMLYNNRFEIDKNADNTPDGWSSAGGTAARTASNGATSGHWSYLLTANNSYYTRVYQTISLSPGYYVMSCNILSSSPISTGGGVAIGTSPLGDGTGWIDSFKVSGGGTTGNYSKVIQLTSAGTYAMGGWINKSASAFTLQFGEITLMPLNAAYAGLTLTAAEIADTLLNIMVSDTFPTSVKATIITRLVRQMDSIKTAVRNLAGWSGTTGTIASVSGAVGSVTGNVGGNVVGSVASVSGNVGGNVVGNVGGNVNGNIVGNVNGTVNGVVGSVSSVLNPVTVGSFYFTSGDSTPDQYATIIASRVSSISGVTDTALIKQMLRNNKWGAYWLDQFSHDPENMVNNPGFEEIPDTTILSILSGDSSLTTTLPHWDLVTYDKTGNLKLWLHRNAGQGAKGNIGLMIHGGTNDSLTLTSEEFNPPVQGNQIFYGGRFKTQIYYGCVIRLQHLVTSESDWTTVDSFLTYVGTNGGIEGEMGFKARTYSLQTTDTTRFRVQVRIRFYGSTEKYIDDMFAFSIPQAASGSGGCAGNGINNWQIWVADTTGNDTAMRAGVLVTARSMTGERVAEGYTDSYGKIVFNVTLSQFAVQVSYFLLRGNRDTINVSHDGQIDTVWVSHTNTAPGISNVFIGYYPKGTPYRGARLTITNNNVATDTTRDVIIGPYSGVAYTDSSGVAALQVPQSYLYNDSALSLYTVNLMAAGRIVKSWNDVYVPKQDTFRLVIQ